MGRPMERARKNLLANFFDDGELSFDVAYACGVAGDDRVGCFVGCHIKNDVVRVIEQAYKIGRFFLCLTRSWVSSIAAMLVIF